MILLADSDSLVGLRIHAGLSRPFLSAHDPTVSLDWAQMIQSADSEDSGQSTRMRRHI